MPRPREGRRGHKHPHGKNQVLRNGPEVGGSSELSDARVSRPSAGCSWPALPAGFGISRVLGSAAPWSARRNRHRVSLRACQTESRRSKGQVRARARCRADYTADRGLARPGTTFSPWRDAARSPAATPCCLDLLSGSVIAGPSNRKTAGFVALPLCRPPRRGGLVVFAARDEADAEQADAEQGDRCRLRGRDGGGGIASDAGGERPDRLARGRASCSDQTNRRRDAGQ